MVLGGIAAAVTAVRAAAHAATVVLACSRAWPAGAGGYAALAALCENRFGVPRWSAACCSATRRRRFASYLARYPLKEPGLQPAADPAAAGRGRTAGVRRRP